MNKKQINRLRRIGLDLDWQAAFGGTSRGNRHLSWVVKLAGYLASAEGGDPSIVEAAAWIHDSALPSGNDYEYARNRRIALKLLKPLGLEQAEAIAVAEAVASHEGTMAPASLEAQIIHDADALEKCGVLGLIRHTWKTIHRDERARSRQRLSLAQVNGVVDHVKWRQTQLHTATAKRISRYLGKGIRRDIARRIVTLVAPLAAPRGPTHTTKHPPS